MDLQLSGKTVLVTGATAGVGPAIARTLVREDRRWTAQDHHGLAIFR